MALTDGKPCHDSLCVNILFYNIYIFHAFIRRSYWGRENTNLQQIERFGMVTGCQVAAQKCHEWKELTLHVYPALDRTITTM